MDSTNRDPFALPPIEKLREIERRQNERAKEIAERRAQQRRQSPNRESNAAEVIQKNYRGYRTRRTLQGYGLDPNTRWVEALKDAEYNRLTQPLPRAQVSQNSTSSDVRNRWRRVGAVMQRAESDDTSESEPELSSEEKRAEYRERKRRQKRERERYSKIMGLEYFLEMVDQKHRYGSNLRRYHQEWKQSDTNENFFYWLDYGGGKDLDLEDRPRSRLDSERVRYLSREERRNYLVRIDDRGRFMWNKNDQPITTSPDFKDSIDGIVPVGDKTPTWREVTTGEKPEPPLVSTPDHSDSDDSATISTGGQEDSSKYVNDELHQAKGLSKLNHISVDTMVNHLLRKTTKKNTWIFVADASFRLYIGIKQSGAFQHSSFLQGARVSAAGLIKIKHGQIRKLSPLSGHYAPPVKNFREFVRSLKSEGADLSRLNISRSYAVILGLEGYMSVKKRAKSTAQGAKDLFNPEDKKRREEEQRDKTQSAEKERRILEAQALEEKRNSLSYRVKSKLGLERDKTTRA